MTDTTTSTSGSRGGGSSSKGTDATKAQKAFADAFRAYLEASLSGSQVLTATAVAQARAALEVALDQTRRLSTTLGGAVLDSTKQGQELTLEAFKALADAASGAGSWANVRFLAPSDAGVAEFVSSAVQASKDLFSAGVVAGKEILGAQRQVAEELISAATRWWN
ncbi:MAG TPA: hypothetical protein VKV36_01440 [Acidimicrobiales bacterium]|nr:hypothetical protein [Acidimicrobiales bacterium]